MNRNRCPWCRRELVPMAIATTTPEEGGAAIHPAPLCEQWIRAHAARFKAAKNAKRRLAGGVR